MNARESKADIHCRSMQLDYVREPSEGEPIVEIVLAKYPICVELSATGIGLKSIWAEALKK